MRVRTAATSLDSTVGETALRPVPRLKKDVMTSFCAGGSISYAYGRTRPLSYRFPVECFCLSPEHHGMQFHAGSLEEPERGHC